MPRQRAPRGDGSVYFRTDRQRWAVEMDVAGADGQPKRHTWSFPTEAEARRKHRELLQARDRGQVHSDERQTVAQFAQRYQSVVVAHQAINTRRAVGVALRKHLLPQFGATRLVQLQPVQVATFYGQLLKQYQPSTIREIHGVFRAMLNQAVSWGDLASNPLVRVKVPSVPKREPAVLQPEQIQRVLTTARGDRLEALVWLAATTGMREGELLGLYWDDVNLSRGTLTVQRQRIAGDGIKAPKTAAGRRTLPLAAPVRAALVRHEARGRNGPLVFPTRTGRPLGPAWLLNRWWYPLLARAGVPRVRLHDVRHGCASFLLWLGMDLAQVSRYLGHSSVSTTARVYAHAIEQGEREMVNKLAELFTPRSLDDPAPPLDDSRHSTPGDPILPSQ